MAKKYKIQIASYTEHDQANKKEKWNIARNATSSITETIAD
jgi:hypothetical protein